MNILSRSLSSMASGVRYYTPKFNNEIIGKTKGFQIRIINSFGKVHRIRFVHRQIPYLKAKTKENEIVIIMRSLQNIRGTRKIENQKLYYTCVARSVSFIPMKESRRPFIRSIPICVDSSC